MEQKIILFDFDKTLTDDDSIILLWKYAFSKKKTNRLIFALRMIRGFFKYIFSLGDFIMLKNELCSVLKLFNEEELEEFVDYLYENHIFKDGIDHFKTLDKKAYKMLVSASPTNYLIYLKKYFDFDSIIGTDLDDDFKVLGQNNKSSAKVKKIRADLKEHDFTIDYENSSAYSDSYKDDRPMLNLVKHRYLINSDIEKDGYENLSWK